ncbi:glycosyltransferase [Apibacter sp. B2912]|nr:glycosyltransferase [Apibacter sp. B2912]
MVGNRLLKIFTMKNPLITVSIPVYNCEKYIERCINSVLNQTYPNIEILIVDDRGKDNSIQIIKNIQNVFPDKIRIIEHNENSGAAAARNTCIDNAKGEYIFFMDGDDEITTDCIEILYLKAYETNATMTIGQITAIDTFSNSEYPIFKFNDNLTFLYNNDIILEYFCNGEWAVSPWNKLLKLNFLKQNNIYFTKGLYAEDELWSFHIALKLDSTAFVNKITYKYYLHKDSIIFNKKKVYFENIHTILERMAEEYYKESSLRKKYILNHIIKFKELALTMQYKVMRKDVDYWKHNYSRLKKAPSLKFHDYFSSLFTIDVKKKNIFQNLPVNYGYKLFKWRYERK